MLFHWKMLVPAIEGLKTGQSPVFQTAIGKGDHMTQPWASNFKIIAWRRAFPVHYISELLRLPTPKFQKIGDR
jgi:hypothetical protein